MAISQTESFVHLCAAAAISTAMLGVGFGALGLTRRVRARPRWAWILGGCIGSGMTLFVANVELHFDPGGAMLPTAIGALVGLAIGIPLVLVGLRGRFVGDHPHCRRCGFDLTGRPESSAVCSECGAPLDVARAIVIGVRRRRVAPLLAGAFLAILSIAVGSAITRQMLVRSGGLSFARYEPTSWLFKDFAKGTRAEQFAALTELYRRMAIGSLGPADVRRFVQLATTGNAAISRVGTMAAAFAWSRGTLDEATMRGVVRSIATASLTLPPQSLPDHVPFEISMPELSMLQTSVVNRCTIEPKDRIDTINGTTLPATTIAGATAGPAFPGMLSTRTLTAPTPFGRIFRLDTPLAAGPANVVVRMTVEVTYAVNGRPTIVEEIPITLVGTTIIVPGLARPLVSSGPIDPMLRPIATVYRNWTPSGTRTFVSVQTFPSPISFVGDAFTRVANGTEFGLGPIVIDRGAGELSLAATLPDDASMTLVLRPMPERGVDYVRQIATYQHEIVIEAARIQRMDQMPRQKR